MRVAFTSTDGKAIDEHFGQATHFHLWEIGADKAEFVEIVGVFGGSHGRAAGLGGTSLTRPPQQDAGQGKLHGHGPDHAGGLGLGASGRAQGQALQPAPERAGGLGGPSFTRSPQQDDDEDDRIKARAEAIEGCTLVYTVQIGGPAAAKLVARRIHPMKTGVELPIEAAVEKLQAVLRGKPPPWLRKAMGLAPEPASLNENEDV